MLITTEGGGFSPLKTLHLESFSGPVGLHCFPQAGAHGGGSGGVLQRSRLHRFPIMQNMEAQFPPVSEKIPIHIVLNSDLTRSESDSLGQMLQGEAILS